MPPASKPTAPDFGEAPLTPSPPTCLQDGGGAGAGTQSTLDRSSEDKATDKATDLDDSGAATIANHCAALLMETIPPVIQFMRREMRQQREPSLSVPQFRVLVFLDLCPGSSLSDLAEHLGVTKATASTMVDRLVQRSYVDRADHPQQRRVVMLHLTPMGRNLLQAMQQITRSKLASLLQGLTTADLSQLADGLAVLSQVFGGAANDTLS